MEKIRIQKKIVKYIIEEISIEDFLKKHLKQIRIFEDETIFYIPDLDYNQLLICGLMIKKGYGQTKLSFDKNKEIQLNFKSFNENELIKDEGLYKEIYNFIINNKFIDL